MKPPTLSESDCHDLLDIFYICDDDRDLMELLQINKLDKFYFEMTKKLEKFCLPELEKER